jgi:hypothetical protein
VSRLRFTQSSLRRERDMGCACVWHSWKSFSTEGVKGMEQKTAKKMSSLRSYLLQNHLQIQQRKADYGFSHSIVSSIHCLHNLRRRQRNFFRVFSVTFKIDPAEFICLLRNFHLLYTSAYSYFITETTMRWKFYVGGGVFGCL